MLLVKVGIRDCGFSVEARSVPVVGCVLARVGLCMHGTESVDDWENR